MAKRLKAPYFDAYFRTPRRRLPPRFAIVTAHNPFGRKLAPAANRRRDAALEKLLRRLGLAHFRVTGGSEDGTHREPGWGIVTSPRAARLLALEHQQDAYFWISSGRIYLGSSGGGRLRRAGSWSGRLARW